MKRLLVVLAAVLGFMVGLVHLLEGQRAEERQRLARLQALVPGVELDQVAGLWLKMEGQRWEYARRGGVWRYPAYFNAYALGDRLDFLVGSLLEGTGTEVAGEAADRGLEAGRRLSIGLIDRQGAVLTEVWIGRGIPDAAAGEVYARQADDQRILHLHANPRSAIDAGRPPLIDRRVLPAARRRAAVAQVEWAWQGGAPVRSIRRVETAPALPGMPGIRPQGPGHIWIGTFADGRQDTCRNPNVYAYLRSLLELRYAALRDPVEQETVGQVVLVDEEGADTLLVGPAGPQGVWVTNRSTGLQSLVSASAAGMLLPTAAALLDSLEGRASGP